MAFFMITNFIVFSDFFVPEMKHAFRYPAYLQMTVEANRDQIGGVK